MVSKRKFYYMRESIAQIKNSLAKAFFSPYSWFMKIQIDPHTLERAEERGTNKEEILDVINSGILIPAKYGRIAKAKVYDFNQSRLNKYYKHKRVEVFYIIEDDMVITVTVYVFYGEWEEKR